MGIPRVLGLEMVRVTSLISRCSSVPIIQSIRCSCYSGFGTAGELKFTRHCRFYSTNKEDKKSSITKVKSQGVTPGTFEQVKENTKTASYLGVIVIGVGVTGIMFYAVLRELFSSKSPNNVYSAALSRCCVEPRVLNALGEPIKGFGEETRRGRRRHVSHLFYQKNGTNYLRMQFYIQGSRRRGTVHLEMKEDDKGKFEYSYLIVKMDDYPPDVIVLEDNRFDVQPNNGGAFEL
ncbi:hypothetical protein R5R35_004942 [Gryllus longicercus]|uniref:Mitochondrial import inner membrane translocase subunit Tim21 n=1 Tax=Gryllus longicercus TaxID=2509291 RepID=A0AAN9Z1W4_9ORTH|nr:Mitochondrial import inner membrane translocase subunit Tim21 [Gryllus bimaculatus]